MKTLGWVAVVAAMAMPAVARATTRQVTCSGSITSALQKAVDASSDGDTVSISAGTCTFGGIGWTNRNIAVVGAGPTATLMSGGSFDVAISNTAKGAFRISGIGFSGTPGGQTIAMTGVNLTASVPGFRLDHLAFSYPNGSGDIIRLAGPLWGLIDHISMTYGGGYAVGIIMSDYLDVEYNNAPAMFMGEYSARQPIDLGGPSAVYIEDSTFTLVGSSAYFPIIDSSSGGQRTVFRHNTVSGGLLYSHWTRGIEWDGHKYEVYNNRFDCNTPSAGPLYLFARFESGTGVVFDNTIQNCTRSDAVIVDEGRGCGGSKVSPALDCNGSRAWDSNGGDSSAPGWPCMGQIGSGCIAGGCARNQMDNVPMILWNNGSQLGCSTGGSCTNSISLNVNDQDGDSTDVCVRPTGNYIKATAHTASVAKYNGAVDYCQGATKPAMCGTYANTYTPYAYPHPLQGNSSPADAGMALDAGMTVDAGMVDSGVTGTPADSGTSSDDAGITSRSDSGVFITDAGAQHGDAGAIDAGNTPGSVTGRCGCSADFSSAGAWGFAAWAIFAARGRSARRSPPKASAR